MWETDLGNVLWWGPLFWVRHDNRGGGTVVPSLSPKHKPLLLAPGQVVTNRDTQELLLCTAYVFEVSTSERGAQHHIYRLVRD